MRIEQSASAGGSPNAISEPLGAEACDAQAEPLDTKIPSAESKWSMVSLLMFGRVTFIM